MQQIDPLVHQHLTPLLELLPFPGTQMRILQRLRQLLDTLLQLHPTCFVFLNHFFHICPPKKNYYVPDSTNYSFPMHSRWRNRTLPFLPPESVTPLRRTVRCTAGVLAESRCCTMDRLLARTYVLCFGVKNRTPSLRTIRCTAGGLAERHCCTAVIVPDKNLCSCFLILFYTKILILSRGF